MYRKFLIRNNPRSFQLKQTLKEIPSNGKIKQKNRVQGDKYGHASFDTYTLYIPLVRRYILKQTAITIRRG